MRFNVTPVFLILDSDVSKLNLILISLQLVLNAQTKLSSLLIF